MTVDFLQQRRMTPSGGREDRARAELELVIPHDLLQYYCYYYSDLTSIVIYQYLLMSQGLVPT